MTITKLQHFQAVCRFQSVTKAAEYLHISQPSVSASIRDLEAEFGINLFRHEKRRLVLTAEGSVFLSHTNHLLEECEQFSLKMLDLGNQKNSVRLAIPPMSGTVYFPKLYKAFKEEHPDIHLAITECGSIQALHLLENGKIDIAMACLTAPPAQQFKCHKLAHSRLALCVSTSHRLAAQNAVTLEQLEGEPLILFHEGSLPSQIVTQQFAAQGIHPNILLYTSQLSMINQMIADGTAAAFLLEDLAQGFEGILSIPLAKPISFDIALIWVGEQYLYHDVSHFLEFSRKFKF